MEIWTTLLDTTSHMQLIIGGSFVLYMCLYWGYGGLLLVLDVRQNPEALYKYKIQVSNTREAEGRRGRTEWEEVEKQTV